MYGKMKSIKANSDSLLTSSSDTRGTRGWCVTRSPKSYDVDVDSDVFLGDVLLFSSSRDFAGGPAMTAVSEARFLRFTLSPDGS